MVRATIANARHVDDFIPRAAEEANAACTRLYGEDSSKWDTWYWDRIFHATMDRLTVHAGLRSKLYDC